MIFLICFLLVLAAPSFEQEDNNSSLELGQAVLTNNRPNDDIQCGIVTRKHNPIPLVTWGKPTLEGQWPWHVAIYLAQTVNNKYICGGTLISVRHVLSTAHCVSEKDRPHNVNTVTLYLGRVEKIILHPRYDHTILRHDVGIMVLSEPVTVTHWVRPVCLWPEEQTQLFDVIGKMGSVVGWGFTEKGEPSENLVLVEMPVVDTDTCVESYADFFAKLTSYYTYCAGLRNGSSVCKGDFGGGMFFEVDNIWYLRGVLSLSVSKSNMCDSSHYVVFADLAKYGNWIKDVLNESSVTSNVSPNSTPNSAEPSTDTVLSSSGSKVTITTESALSADITLLIDDFGTQCGKVKIKKGSTSLVVQGNLTLPGQWPWQAAIYQITEAFEFVGGGTLVSRNHIVTAGHCVTKYGSRTPVQENTLTIFLGKHYRKDSSEGVQIRLVERIIVHPEYHGLTQSRDLAILQLYQPVTYTTWVQPACLWPENMVDLTHVVGKSGSVVGWGYEANGELAEELKLVEMPVVSQETCIRSYSDFFVAFTSDYTFCAGDRKGSSPCNGDSGGGMVFKMADSWYLRGVVSLAVSKADKTCDPSHYIIFTDVAKLLSWIKPRVFD